MSTLADTAYQETHYRTSTSIVVKLSYAATITWKIIRLFPPKYWQPLYVKRKRSVLQHNNIHLIGKKEPYVMQEKTEAYFATSVEPAFCEAYQFALPGWYPWTPSGNPLYLQTRNSKKNKRVCNSTHICTQCI